MVDGYRPANLAQALRIRAEHECLPLAGGTDLMVQHARGSGVRPGFHQPLLFLAHLTELRRIVPDGQTLRIGAAVTLTELLHCDQVAPVLRDIVLQMASPPTRNLATIGGNIGNASPAGDTLPYLYALNADLIVQSIAGIRQVPVADFITGPRQTTLQRHELITEIIIPRQSFTLSYYKKVGQRRGMSLTKASFLGLATIADKRITDLRIAFGSVAPTVVRSLPAEALLIGKPVADTARRISGVVRRYESLIQPIDDARSTARYRRQVCLNLLTGFSHQLMNI